jgi:hypothetical protein
MGAGTRDDDVGARLKKLKFNWWASMAQGTEALINLGAAAAQPWSTLKRFAASEVS